MGLIPVRLGRRRRFEALIAEHHASLYRTAYRWTRSVQDAEDLVQEVCARAWPRLDELERLERPKSWLMRVMYRLFVDLTRRHDRTRTDLLDDRALASLRDDRPGPADLTERERLAERLARAWVRIDRDRRALLSMHDVEGYSLAELAEITGLKEGTIKSRLHRTRVVLGRMLAAAEAGASLKTGTGGGER